MLSSYIEQMTRKNPIYHQNETRLQREAKMIERAKQDPAAFEALYKIYHEQIFRYVYQRTANMDVTSDLVSQVFLKAMTNLKTYTFRGVPFSSWLYRIAMSEMNQWFRDSQKQRVVSVPTDSLSGPELALDMDNQSDDARYALVVALRALPSKDLELIEMRYFEQRSVKEIAEILDLSESNVKVRCHRAIKKLKTLFHNNFSSHETT